RESCEIDPTQARAVEERRLGRESAESAQVHATHGAHLVRHAIVPAVGQGVGKGSEIRVVSGANGNRATRVRRPQDDAVKNRVLEGRGREATKPPELKANGVEGGIRTSPQVNPYRSKNLPPRDRGEQNQGRKARHNGFHTDSPHHKTVNGS